MSRKTNKSRNTRVKESTRGNGRGQRNKTRSDAEIAESKDAVKNSGNDPSWYAANPALLRDAASYPFSYNTGATEIHDKSLYGTDFENIPNDQIAGVCSLHVHPTVGTAINSTDPINVAAQSIYSFVRHANSGHSNYDSPDLMIYIMAMAYMYSFLVWCQRLYGYALTYDQRNRYIPNDLVRMNNVDSKDLVNNLANFRFWINTLIQKMVSFAVPATMSVFSRMSFIYSDHYVEGTSIKDQLYQFVPDGFYKFDLDSDGSGFLDWIPFDYTTPMSVSDIMQYGDDMFEAIWSQEDFGIMSGDILKAYGSNIIKLAPLPEYYNIVPKFDPMVLTQMKNADLVRADITPIRQSTTSGTVIQSCIPQGYTTSDTWYGTSTAINSAQATLLNKVMVAIVKDYRILTVETDDPTPDVVIEATRLKTGYDAFKAWYNPGTEVITKVVVASQPGTDITIEPIIVTYDGLAGDPAFLKFVFAMLEAVRNFHYMPRIWVAIFNQANSKLSLTQHFDIDNFTLLSEEDVRKLHEAATINMFAVPSIGKV